MEFKTYETAREIIDCLVDFHHRAASMAETAMDLEQDERVKLVFNFLYDHHQQMQETLATYEVDGEDSVLNTYVPFKLVAERSPEAFIEDIEFHDHMSFEDVQTLAKDVADYIIELLNDIEEEIVVESVQEVFANIGEMEQEELKLVMRGINSLRDF